MKKLLIVCISTLSITSFAGTLECSLTKKAPTSTQVVEIEMEDSGIPSPMQGLMGNVDGLRFDATLFPNQNSVNVSVANLNNIDSIYASSKDELTVGNSLNETYELRCEIN